MGLLFGSSPKSAINLKHLLLDVPPSRDTIAPYQPTLADKVASKVSGGLQSLGLGSRSAQRMAGKLTGALDALTPFGAATGAQQAGRSYQAGHYKQAAMDAAGALLSALPDGGATMTHGAAGVLHSIIAPLFHGSPHKFEKFALERIGTGEGNQAYGHGLYFAENPAVAKEYQQTLAGASVQLPDGQIINQTTMPFATPEDQAKRAAIQLLADHGSVKAAKRMTTSPNIHRELDNLVGAKPTGGHLYEVKLDANPEDFLNWDAPIGQQPRVADGLASLGLDQGRWRGSEAGMPGDLAYHTIVERNKTPGTLGLVADHNARIAATQRLNDAGVKGIRYLDQGSRGAGQGTSNYVVFDPSIIDILKRH